MPVDMQIVPEMALDEVEDALMDCEVDFTLVCELDALDEFDALVSEVEGDY